MEITKTRRGLPAYWIRWGSSDGVVDRNGRIKNPVFVDKKQKKSLVILNQGDWVILLSETSIYLIELEQDVTPRLIYEIDKEESWKKTPGFLHSGIRTLMKAREK
jgi:hypothetical protein